MAETRDGFVERIRGLSPGVLGEEKRAGAGTMLADFAMARLRAANRRSSEQWHKIAGKDEWERFRDARLAALRAAIGPVTAGAQKLQAEVISTISGDGFRIENVVFASLPGVVVTGNLYLPDPPRSSMLGVLICHSHHRPKTQGELQDMGMTWARGGAAVLVIDLIGHGERAQHPFNSAPDAEARKLFRQDYHWRYFLGMQMHVAGQALLGWLARDLMSGVDLLLSRPGIDPARIILMGAVAGGGDPAAVAAALDPRITCAIPFNFGGPQPEAPYPLPADAEESFLYSGAGSWESTRNPARSAGDGFLPWVIVGSIGPRPLVYAHEFSWDRPRDPVWPRLGKIYGFYDAPGNLSFTHGHGVLQNRPPAASHCTNIGPVHRALIYPALERWFRMAPPEKEFEQRRTPAELACLTPAAAAKWRPRKVHELLAEQTAARVAAARAALAGLAPAQRRERLREDWARLLGEVASADGAKAKTCDRASQNGLAVERVVIEVEPGQPGIVVPLLLLLPQLAGKGRAPVVVAFGQQGKAAILARRAEEISRLIGRGVAVALADLRGTGETSPGEARGPEAPATAISSTELMLGRTLVGSRLRDLRTVLAYLRTRGDVDARRVGLWGDSFSPTNPPELVDPPIGPESQPQVCEPLGQLLALFGGLFEDDVRAVLARGGLLGFASMLDGIACYVPHDVIVPGALTAGDLCDVAAALAPRPLRMESLVDGRNINPADEGSLGRWFAPARQAYAAAPDRLTLSSGISPAADWLADGLQ